MLNLPLKSLHFVIIYIGLLLLPITSEAEPTQLACPNSQKISKKFPSGASWQLCLLMKDKEGPTPTQVYYQAPNASPRKVLGSLSLAQTVLVPDGNIDAVLYPLTENGYGENLQTLTSNDCPKGNLKKIGTTKNTICRTIFLYSTHYKYETQRTGSFFELKSNSYIKPYKYTLRWRFFENGVIEGALGFSKPGAITLESGLTQHVGWRIDFDLGEKSNDDSIEEVINTPSSDFLKKSSWKQVLTQETARVLGNTTHSLWHVLDGSSPQDGVSAPSYELSVSNYNYHQFNPSNKAWLENDIYFTRYKACERFSSQNNMQKCPPNGNTDIYIKDSEQLSKADIVVWYNQTYHHIFRSEDKKVMPTVWTSFQLTPRDWNRQNPF